MEANQDKLQFTPARRAAINRAFDEHGALIEGFFYRRIRKRETAEDLSQIFWKQVYVSFKTEDIEKRGLLLHKAKQVLSNFLRHSGIRAFVEFDSAKPELGTAHANNLYLDDIAAESRYWLMEAPEVDLSDTDKKLFWMRARHDATFQEIAQALNMAVSTVQDRYQKIRSAMEHAYNKERV